MDGRSLRVEALRLGLGCPEGVSDDQLEADYEIGTVVRCAQCGVRGEDAGGNCNSCHGPEVEEVQAVIYQIC